MTLGQLKSALQKNVRRGRREEAVNVAAALLRKDVVQFVRRFMIIVLEDAVLHPDFPLLSWLLLATSKGFVPDTRLMQECLRIVWEVAGCAWRDTEPIDAMFAGGEDSIDSSPSVAVGTASADAMGPAEAAIIRAILCRSRFGGMKGDMRMLGGFARLWRERFLKTRHNSNNSSSDGGDGTSRINSNGAGAAPVVSPPPTSSSWLAFMQHAAHSGPEEREMEGASAVEQKRPRSFAVYLNRGLHVSDVPLSAIDFHCVPGIIDHLLAGGDSSIMRADQAASLRSAMWYFSSSHNTKTLVTTGRSRADGGEQRQRLLKLWAAHQRGAVAFQRHYIQSRFS